MTATPWAEGEPTQLAALAHQIEANGSWRSYLSVKEHKLFELALQKGSRTWAAFLEGAIPLQLQVTEMSTEEGSTELSTPQVSTVLVDPVNMAFRVRYMLWDAGVAAMFGAVSPLGDLTINDTKLDASIPSGRTSTVRATGEDDEYDDEDDDENDDDTTSGVAGELLDLISVEIEDDDEDLDIRAHRDTLFNYTRMYHTFETDLDSIVRYRKLQESDRQVNIESDRASIEKLASTAQFGAANLSLKHMLNVIESKRDEMNLTDVELRNLISDVRRNRSKWASEDRIGQEELYEAAEKVVSELRATTEHSTAFLNRVSKREAPNYYQIIKTPMDLNTVMKKLKTLQYNSKKEFVDDVMVIWQNCFTYNSDPKHFLRAHATVMRKKTLSLTPLIPDITVRSRAEVEAEAQAEAQAEQQEAAEEGRGKGTKSSKGVKRQRTESAGAGNEPIGEATADAANGEDTVMHTEEVPAAEDVEIKQEGDSENAGVTDSEIKPEAETVTGIDDEQAKAQRSTYIQPPASRQSTPAVLEKDGTPHPDVADSPGEADETMAAGDTTAIQHETEIEAARAPDDVETVVWTRAYSQRRADYLTVRHELFGRESLKSDAPAPLRRPLNMARFVELQDTVLTGAHDERSNLRGVGDDAILTEYDVVSAVPPAPAAEPNATGYVPALSDLAETGYLARGKLADKYNANLNEMQKIRRLCAKINVVKEMQNNPQNYTPFDLPSLPDIVDPEPDVSSRLPNADKTWGPAAQAGMRRTVSKIAMHTGFEACRISAIDTLADIAGDYMTKLGQLLASSLEDPYLEASPNDLILASLMDMGISSVSSLAKHVTNDVFKYNKKLADLQRSVGDVLRELLRPGIEKYKDEQFGDNSEQFTLGQFSNELGDDYFGFKELGLDKELGVDTVAIPFHLLQQRAVAENVSTGASKHVYRLDLPSYPPMTAAALPGVVGILRPYFERRFQKSGNADLVEDDNITGKQRFVRPRVPVTGKILPKRKPRKLVFYKPTAPPKRAPSEPPADNHSEPFLDDGSTNGAGISENRPDYEPAPEPEPEPGVITSADDVAGIDPSKEFDPIKLDTGDVDAGDVGFNLNGGSGSGFLLEARDPNHREDDGDLDLALDAFESFTENV